MSDDRVLTVTIEIPVAAGRNLNRGTARERVAKAAARFVQAMSGPTVGDNIGLLVSDATIRVSYDYRRFAYEEAVVLPRPRRVS